MIPKTLDDKKKKVEEETSYMISTYYTISDGRGKLYDASVGDTLKFFKFYRNKLHAAIIGIELSVRITPKGKIEEEFKEKREAQQEKLRKEEEERERKEEEKRQNWPARRPAPPMTDKPPPEPLYLGGIHRVSRSGLKHGKSTTKGEDGQMETVMGIKVAVYVPNER